MPMNPLAVPSVVISVLILAAAAFLAAREWLERRGRDEDLEADEANHLAVRDVRRRAGIILMTVMGALASVGFWINPAAGRDEARRVFASWVAIGAVLIVMMVLAGLDWFHTALYARRARQELAGERAALLEAIRRRARRREGGETGPSRDDPTPS